MLGAYDIEFNTGDHLRIGEGKAILPVHRNLVLLIGLLGRFTNRANQGMDRNSKPLTWGGFEPIERELGEIGPSTGERDVRIVREREEVLYDRRDEGRRDIAQSRNLSHSEVLYGLTGSLKFVHLPATEGIEDGPRRAGLQLSFEASQELNSLKIPPESLDLRELYLLACGFIPFGQDRYYSLADGQAIEEVLTFLDRDLEREDPFLRARNTRPREYEREEITRTREYEREEISRPRAYEREEIIIRREEEFSAFELSQPGSSRKLRDLYNLAPAEGSRDEILYLLQHIDLDEYQRSELQEYGRHTYVPADSKWIRLKTGDKVAFRGAHSDVYIRRAHAQTLALALLTMRWHPENCLVGATPGSGRCMDLLCSNANDMLPTMNRMNRNVKTLRLGPDEQTKFLDATEAVLQRHRGPLSLATPSLCSLNQVLLELRHDSHYISDMVGILMLTNEEFSSLVTHSTRYLDTSSESTIEFDLREGTVRVPSIFGLLQTFYVDMDVLYPASGRTREVFKVAYPYVLIAALHACLCSTMLKNSLDAAPLMRITMASQDIVQMI